MNACLGRGGFGEVYRATLDGGAGLQQDVAVKVLRADLDMREDAERRLRDEGRLLGHVNHPAIPKVVDLVMLDGRIGLVTEYVEGRDLGDALASGDPPPLRAQLQALAQVASALEAALRTPGPDGTALSLVHRDIKPENIRLGRHGDAKLLDFGIAWSASSSREARTATGLVVGSLPWMSPERFVSNHCTSAADVFALGAVLYAGLSGASLYVHSAMAKVAAIATDPLRYREHVQQQLMHLEPEVPASVRALLHQMVAFEAQERPGVGEVAVALDALADEVGGPGLRAWARSHDWPDVGDLGGEWVGRTLKATTLSQRTASPAPPLAPPPPPSLPPGLAERAGQARITTQGKATLDEGFTTWEHTPPPASSRQANPTIAPGPDPIYPPVAAERDMTGGRPAATLRPGEPLPMDPPGGRTRQAPEELRPSQVDTLIEEPEPQRPSQVKTLIEGDEPLRPSEVKTFIDGDGPSTPRRGEDAGADDGLSPMMAGVTVFFVVLFAGVLVAIGVLGGALLMSS